jgi:hypothetical protein
MDHAIDAGEGRPSATVSVWVEFLLGQDIAARLAKATRQRVRCTSIEVIVCMQIVRKMIREGRDREWTVWDGWVDKGEKLVGWRATWVCQGRE